MRTKAITLLTTLTLLFNGVFAQTGPSFQPKPKNAPYEFVQPDTGTEILKKDENQEVYVALGYVTYLEFPKKSKIGRVDVGSKTFIKAEVDVDHNAVVLSPLVAQGHTNMTVILDGTPYNFLIRIVPQGDIDYRITYVTADQGYGAPEIYGPALRPGSLDTAKLIKAVEAYTPGMNEAPSGQRMIYNNLNKAYTWNKSVIYLADSFGFPELNLVVLRILRRNLSTSANYLHTDQIRVRMGNSPYPVTEATQSSALLYPGQMERIYLFIQGYNLSAKGAFEIDLPPEAAQIEAYLNKQGGR